MKPEKLEPMTGTDFGLALLKALEEQPNEDTKPFATAIRKALGVAPPEQAVPFAFLPQLVTPKEVPQWRIKYNASGKEIARRRVDSMRDLEHLFNSEREILWQQSFAVPLTPDELLQYKP